MRPIAGIFMLLLLFNQFHTLAQNQFYFCGNEEMQSDNENSITSSCFKVDDIFQNCTPIYIRVNLHFFVNDNCEGKIQQVGKSQKDIYHIAEEVIHFANATFENNEAQRKSTNTKVPCVPIRLLLKGIYTHCKTNAYGIYTTPDLNDKFGINTSTEINFYIANTQDGASGIGFHNMRCGSAVDFDKDHWWTIGNFTHEMGHLLSLSHSFEFDDCDDTPVITYDWDKNCNGILEESSDRNLDETNLTCWNNIEPNKKSGDPGYSDINKNNVNDCDEQIPCTPCPCCNPEFIDNNVMSYSATKSALTECQIRKMLSDLSSYNCAIIEKIGGCPPTSAFITQTPEDMKDHSNCSECLILEASVNEDEYELKIYEQINNQEILVYNGGWKSGPAGKFCFRTGKSSFDFVNYLKPNAHYIAYLKTRNSCSEDEYHYSFITNDSDCSTPGYDHIRIAPNPGSDHLTAEVDLHETSDYLQVLAKNQLTGLSYNLQTVSEGTNNINLDITFLPPGLYVLIIIGDYSLYQNTFVKL